MSLQPFMSIPTKYQKVPGLIMAIGSAVFWGISGTCAQYLFEQKGLDPGWLVCWRMLLAGLILVLFSMSEKKFRHLPNLEKKPLDVVKLLLFSILGMVAVQFTYFYSISLSNAATATVLQYIGPLLVVGFYAIKHRRWPILAEYASLALALVGTFLLVTHGSFDTLVISEAALFWGFLSALALAFYTIQPVGLLRTYSPSTITGWGMLLGGIAFSHLQPLGRCRGFGIWKQDLLLPTSFFLEVCWILLFFLKSVTIIGATTASLLCSVEPLAAAGVAVVWLGIYFGRWTGWGLFFILLTIVLLTLSTKGKDSQSELSVKESS